MNNSIVAYVTKNDDTIDTLTFNVGNSNHVRCLLSLLHDIGNGMEGAKKITFLKV